MLSSTMDMGKALAPPSTEHSIVGNSCLPHEMESEPQKSHNPASITIHESSRPNLSSGKRIPIAHVSRTVSKSTNTTSFLPETSANANAMRFRACSPSTASSTAQATQKTSTPSSEFVHTITPETNPGTMTPHLVPSAANHQTGTTPNRASLRPMPYLTTESLNQSLKRDTHSGQLPHPEIPQHQESHDVLPIGLRNKKMKPTDCLLFAATLLSQEEEIQGAKDRSSRNGLLSQGDLLDNSFQRRDVSMASPPVRTDMGEELSEEPSSELSTDPKDVDVLCGRGGLINKHPGNIVYRKVVEYNKPFYQSVHKKHRILVSQSIVQSILNCGGRFLTHGAQGNAWYEIGYKRAVQKTSQALRERVIQQEDDENSNGRIETDDPTGKE